MSFQVTNLEILVTPSQTANPWAQLYFDLTNGSGSDLDQTIYVRYFYGIAYTDRQYRLTVADGQTERILTPRIPLADPDTVTSVRFELPGGNVEVTDANFQVTDYNPVITIDQHELGLYPTRADRPDGMPSPLPSGWFGDFSLNLQSSFLEPIQLINVNYIYDDGTELNRGPYYVDDGPLRPGFVIPIQANENYSIDRMGTANQGDFPLIFPRDKAVAAIVLTFEPGDTLNQRIDERFDLRIDPVISELFYTPMSAQITTAGNSIYLTVSGGLPPYTYYWQDGSTEQNRLNVSPGLYTVIVTDDLGETATFYARLGDLHYFSDNPITLSARVADHAQKDFLRMICQVWYEKDYLSDNYEQLFEAEQPLNGQGETQFNVQSILDSVLQPQLPSLSLQRQDQQFKRFYLRYFERYGNDPEQSGSVTQVQENYLLLGGVSQLEYAQGNFFGNYFQNGPFYTWQPHSKPVYPDQPEYLTFVVNSFDYTEFAVKARLYYIAEDGTESSEEITLFSQSDVKKYEAYCFPVGVGQLYLLGYSCAELDRYAIYCQSGQNVVSEEREYVLDYKINPYRRYFIFQNSLGGWDTLVTTGRAEHEVSIRTEALEKYLPPKRSPLAHETDILSRSATPETSLSAGYKTRAMMAALQDFLVSRTVYLSAGSTVDAGHSASGGTLIPVEIDVRSVTIEDEDADLQSFSFSYRPPRFDRFTPTLESPASAFIPLSAQAEINEDNLNDIRIISQGGTPPYMYRWQDDNRSAAHTGPYRNYLPKGEYSVVVRDSSSPAQAVTLCNLLLTEAPPLGDPTPGGPTEAPVLAGYTFESQYWTQDGQFFQTPPGYQLDTQITNISSVSLTEAENFNGRYRVSCYIFLPPGDYTSFVRGVSPLQAQDDFELNFIIPNNTPIVRADLTLYNQWQYMETITDTNGQNFSGIVQFNLGINNYSGGVYFSDLQIEKLS